MRKIKIKASKNRLILYAFLIVVLIPLVVGIYNVFKPIPEGISYEGKTHNISDSDITFLYDLNYRGVDGENVIEQQIFDNIFKIINESERFIVIDMFLFNQDYTSPELIPITSELKDALIEKKKAKPGMNITFITDEINNFYGSYTAEHLLEMRESGIDVIITDLRPLRDSNPAWSSIWRSYVQWFGTSGEGWIKHPLGNTAHNVTIRAIMKVLNAKANHRKLIVADSGESVMSLVTSANPHEGSSKHSNTAVIMRGRIGLDILQAEEAVARMSNSEVKYSLNYLNDSGINAGEIEVQFLTEGKIERSLLKEIASAKSGDSIDIAMFYLSDRDIVREILRAHERNVSVRLVLDPNKDAFGREKNGIPNRQVAYELFEKSNGKIQIRWYSTRGEQFHTKIVIIRKNGRVIIFIGSANLTKRNIGNLNLEANVRIEAPIGSDFERKVSEYYGRIWNNQGGEYTLEFESYKDSSFSKYIRYRAQEFTGLSTF